MPGLTSMTSQRTQRVPWKNFWNAVLVFEAQIWKNWKGTRGTSSRETIQIPLFYKMKLQTSDNWKLQESATLSPTLHKVRNSAVEPLMSKKVFFGKAQKTLK